MKIKIKKEVWEYLISLNYAEWEKIRSVISEFFDTEHKLKEREFERNLYLNNDELNQRIDKGFYRYPITLQFEDKED